MKLYFVKGIPVSVQNALSVYFDPVIDFIPFHKKDPEENQLCDRLRQKLSPEESGHRTRGLLGIHLKSLEFRTPLQIVIFVKQGGNRGGKLKILRNEVTDALVQVFGEEVTLKVELEDLLDENENINLPALSSPEMKVVKQGEFACEDNGFPYGNDSLAAALENRRDISGVVSGILTVNKPKAEVSSEAVAIPDKMHIVKRLLLEELETDLVIKPGSGNPVKAHKAFLTAHSDVFRNMFQSAKKGSTLSGGPVEIELAEMTEEGVKAMLAYLYYWDKTEANAKCDVAFELLTAGHKYNIPVMEAAMKKVLISKDDQWYGNKVDLAMKLFLFARFNLPKKEDQLKMKAIKILKLNFATLDQSRTYRNLFKENPEAAMELCKYSLGYAT